MKAFKCDKCEEHFTRGQRALEKSIPFDGARGPRTLVIDMLYRCVHTKRGTGFKGVAYDHGVDFCDDCLLWFLDEYKGSIMVEVGRKEDVTEDDKERAS